MKFITDFFPPTLESLFWMLLKIAIIIAVIMIVMEILKALKVLDWLNKVLFHFTKHLGITPQASTPLLVGILLGITYGAGPSLPVIPTGNDQKGCRFGRSVSLPLPCDYRRYASVCVDRRDRMALGNRPLHRCEHCHRTYQSFISSQRKNRCTNGCTRSRTSRFSGKIKVTKNL